jgi:hypothetical protein
MRDMTSSATPGRSLQQPLLPSGMYLAIAWTLTTFSAALSSDLRVAVASAGAISLLIFAVRHPAIILYVILAALLSFPLFWWVWFFLTLPELFTWPSWKDVRQRWSQIARPFRDSFFLLGVSLTLSALIAHFLSRG